MAKTYRFPRKFSINGRAGRVPPAKVFNIPEVDQAFHDYKAKKKLHKERKKCRRWKLAAATATERCL